MNFKYSRLFFIIFLSLIFASVFASAKQKNKLNYYNLKKIAGSLTPEDSAKSISALAEEIDNILAKNKLQKSNFGISIYSIDRKKSVYTKNAEQPLTPASTTKLFTTYTALYLMGPNYPIKTQIFAKGKKAPGGIINGDLYIQGHGDALLTSSELDSLVSLLTKLGIKKINGNVYADASYFDNNTNRFHYSGDADEVQPVAPVTALSIDKNLVTVVVTGSAPGNPPTVRTIPNSEGFKIINSAKTSGAAQIKKKRSRSMIDDDSEFEYTKINDDEVDLQPDCYGGSLAARRSKSYRPSIKISSKQVGGFQNFYVTGSISSGASYSYSFNLQNPPLAAAGALKAKLIEYGIEVTGIVGENKLVIDKGTKLLAEFNRPLISLIFDINKNSDNYVAEHVFKIIGAYSGNHTDCAAEASKRISSLVGTYSLAAPQYKINDGSGLSRRNKATPACITNLLSSAYHMPWYEDFLSTLSIAGFDGTLRKRMTNSRAEQRLRGKTGTHSNVSALAGYAVTLDGENIAFAFMYNGSQVGLFKSIEDELGKIISRFFYYHEDF